MNLRRTLAKWIAPGLGIKRWLFLQLSGFTLIALALAAVLAQAGDRTPFLPLSPIVIVLLAAAGITGAVLGLVGFSNALLKPFRANRRDTVVDTVYAYSRRQKGLRVVAIGGGTGLPATLRAMKPYTSHITAIVTVADDGGSSGRLRRELGVLPPGDLRNNIAALAEEESLMTQLFQHRFSSGDLGGHAFGNLFISALAAVTGSLESALVETGRVLNIQGQVFPATMEDVDLVASVRVGSRVHTIRGESRITAANGRIEDIFITPRDVKAFAGSVNAILNAEVVVLGPGSLYTSIIPNLLVPGIQEALRQTSALKIFVCNIATQPGETDGYTVSDHVLALERVIGRGVVQVILANNHFTEVNAGENTRYVRMMPDGYELFQRYAVYYADLVDEERPWRHDPSKLAAAILQPNAAEKLVSQHLISKEMPSVENF
jgi:uncharacterized cofD-like protein